MSSGQPGKLIEFDWRILTLQLSRRFLTVEPQETLLKRLIRDLHTMPPKPEIRRLFKQQHHPFAKYDGQGRLICAVCSVQVKNESLWSSHLSGSSHKENIAKLKALKEKQNRSRQKQEELKRPAPVDEKEDHDDPAAKKPRLEDLQNEEELNEVEDTEMQDTSDALPSDFFDKYNSVETEAPDTADQEEGGEEAVESSGLPTGFFDNPDEEAQVLNKPTSSEKNEAELERDYVMFKEAMIETTATSEKVEEEDEENIAISRDEALFQQQAELDARVAALKNLRQQGGVRRTEDARPRVEYDDTEHEIRTSLKNSVRDLLKNKPNKKTQAVFDDMDEDESDEDEDEEADLGWRAQQL
ncbi:hypothetical protein DFQ28_004710 [Apophysomyces sp. BC1034]|nr:hypothetical protein DFQ29_003688 [Apophysomyces sp. BC1021]KAG0188553.1 hypothetical protein DFQ28_004710 [Apophysomyces sp. BC1034]